MYRLYMRSFVEKTFTVSENQNHISFNMYVTVTCVEHATANRVSTHPFSTAKLFILKF